MLAKYTEFREYMIFYSKISQYKVFSTKPRWRICKKKQENVEISKTDWRQYTKLEYKYNLTKHGTRSLPDFKSNP